MTEHLFVQFFWYPWSVGHIDVCEECWRRNVLVTTLRCWWWLRSPTPTIFLHKRRAPTFKRFHKHRNSVTNIHKSSQTLIHQHDDVTNIAVLFVRYILIYVSLNIVSFLLWWSMNPLLIWLSWKFVAAYRVWHAMASMLNTLFCLHSHIDTSDRFSFEIWVTMLNQPRSRSCLDFYTVPNRV